MRGGTPSSANPVGGSTGGRVAIVVSADVLETWTERSEEAGRRAGAGGGALPAEVSLLSWWRPG